LVRRHLSYTDRTGEVAFAVIMVIIINGYVSLSNLNTGFLYIVFVNLGACLAWGLIDGFIYAISNSIERNITRNKLMLLKSLTEKQNVLDDKQVLGRVEDAFDDTFLSSFSKEGKGAIAKNVLEYAPQASVKDNRVLTKEDALGWVSIVLIYLTVGFLLALPFLVLSDKITAWFISNFVGVLWLFWYGTQLGKSVGKYRLILGFAMAAIGISFIVGSYLVWAG
jgi:VIT1/CCC1 family predicted Fe2+/Mn2+ transporter